MADAPRAIDFVVNSGYIRAKVDPNNSAWDLAFTEDTIEFAKAIQEAAPMNGVTRTGTTVSYMSGTNPPYPIDQRIGNTLGFSTITSNSFSIAFTHRRDTHQNATMMLEAVITCGDDEFKFGLGSDTGNSGYGNSVYHWAILRDKHGDLGIMIARNAGELKSVATPDAYQGPAPSDVRETLCAYTPIAFFIVDVLDSFYCSTGYGGLIVPSTPGCVLDDNDEFLAHFDTVSPLISVNYTYGSAGSQYTRPCLLTGDTAFYLSGYLDEYEPWMSNTAAGTFLTALYSGVSRCVTSYALALQFGPGHNPQHAGPEVISYGEQYMVRSGNIFLPVNAT